MRGIVWNHRASLNLEMALLIMLLVLSCVMGLSWMGFGIANVFNGTTDLLTAGGESGPGNGSATDNGDGTATITWTGGTGPFLIRRNVLPVFDGTQPIVADNLPSQSYTGIVPPGDVYLSIEDSEGRSYTLPSIIHITDPAPEPPTPLDPAAITGVATDGIRTLGLRQDGTVETTGNFTGLVGATPLVLWADIREVQTSWLGYVVGIHNDGTVSVLGGSPEDYSSWNVKQAVFTSTRLVGLQSDGTILSYRDMPDGWQGTVSGWSGVESISTDVSMSDADYIVGIKGGQVLMAGTMAPIGPERGSVDYMCDGDSGATWSDVESVACGPNHVAALTSAGTVLSTGFNHFGQRDGLGSWSSITQLVAGDGFTLGLRSDGTVLATGGNAVVHPDHWTVDFGDPNTPWITPSQLDEIRSWSGIQRLYARSNVVVGLRSDGTCVAVSLGGPDVSALTNVESLSISNTGIVAVRTDGTCQAVSGAGGWTDDGNAGDVGEWGPALP